MHNFIELGKKGAEKRLNLDQVALLTGDGFGNCAAILSSGMAVKLSRDELDRTLNESEKPEPGIFEQIEHDMGDLVERIDAIIEKIDASQAPPDWQEFLNLWGILSGYFLER